MIRFRISIGIPGYLDAEDELSNLLQGEGEEGDLVDRVRESIRAWVTAWIPRVPAIEVRVKMEQE